LRISNNEWKKLFDYQKEGVIFLYNLHKNIGGVLADDMGLGKTVQVCVFLNALYHSLAIKSGDISLIVLPVSLIENWKSELSKW
jgi:DNA excision repair protein ERCC-6